jgi:hypothetical protein
MNVLLFGASGMVGQGVLRECLLEPDVTRVVAVVRRRFMFRPGAIMPLHGIRSSTRWYNVAYAAIRPIYPLLRRVAPTTITTTEQLGRAMLAVARNGYATHVLEMADINRLSTWT